MAVTIRLMRFGKKKQPVYRIVVLDKRKKRNGSYLEKIGFYNPLTEPALITLDERKFADWLAKGAEISDGLTRILKKKLAKKPKMGSAA
jgi:small subunit ribosomal protein S16